MSQKHENRRVRMTKRLLQDALLVLLEQNELANISVTSLCAQADVHRSTFYKYYSDPTDLLKEIEQDILDQIPTPPQILDKQNQDQLLLETSAFFDFVKQNEKALRVLFSNNTGSDFSARLVDFLCNGYIPVGNDSGDLSDRFTQLYIANGTVGMMREWIVSGFPFTSQKITEMMYFLSKKVIS